MRLREIPRHGLITRPVPPPTLRLGRDRLPRACWRCGGALLDLDEPLGRERYGQLTCCACGVVLAHLIASSDRRPHRHPDPPSPELAWRLPGCGDGCQPDSHEALAHEEHGRRRAVARIERDGPLGPPVPIGPVRTGGLLIDPDACCVVVDGHELIPPEREWAILLYLAANLGLFRTYHQIATVGWGAEQAERWRYGGDSFRTVRANISRLRARLGPCRRLLVTIPQRGYRLTCEPYTGALSS